MAALRVCAPNSEAAVASRSNRNPSSGACSQCSRNKTDTTDGLVSWQHVAATRNAVHALLDLFCDHALLCSPYSASPMSPASGSFDGGAAMLRALNSPSRRTLLL